MYYISSIYYTYIIFYLLCNFMSQIQLPHQMADAQFSKVQRKERWVHPSRCETATSIKDPFLSQAFQSLSNIGCYPLAYYIHYKNYIYIYDVCKIYKISKIYQIKDIRYIKYIIYIYNICVNIYFIYILQILYIF